jgi:hypothetical protein
MSNVITSIWKVWLRPYFFLNDASNNYVAEVSTAGRTIHNEDVARIMIAEGSEYHYETILSILNRKDSIVMHHIKEGGTAQDRCVRIAPRVPGVWRGLSLIFNPVKNKPTVDLTATVELRDILSEVTVEVLGVKEASGFIAIVVDTTTGDASGLITPADDIIISGDKIKVLPEDDETTGVFLDNNATGTSYRVTRRLIQNTPKKILARLPNLPIGEYTLRIVTRYSNSNHKLLTELRTITYDNPLRVEPSE